MYALKEDDKRNVTWKTRYVPEGYSQVEGLGYSETFSPTANLTSLRVPMQLAAQHDQTDAKPHLYICPVTVEYSWINLKDKPKNDLQLVWKLNKSIYGLKQSGRKWNRMLHDHV